MSTDESPRRRDPRVDIALTHYHLTTSGTGPDTTLTVRDESGQPASAFTLYDARQVALALINNSIALDAWPPYALRTASEPVSAAPGLCAPGRGQS